MIHWLYRYVFKGFGVVMIIAMLTILVLAITSQMNRSSQKSVPAPASVRR